MFESLDDQMKHDAAEAGGKVQRILCVAAAFVAAVLLLGGIYFGVRMFQ